MNKDHLLQLLKFTEFTNLFANIQRKTITNKNGTFESNPQHSFQMAILAWYLCDVNKLNLNIDKIMRYALVHDLVETYSGNFPAYSRNDKNQEIKNNSEVMALEKIKNDFQEFKDLLNTLENYNKMEDEESKFIYALDKLIPIINIELNNNDFYFRTKTTKEDMLKVKKEKIAKHKIIENYFILLQDYLTNDVKFFWPDCEKRDYSKKEYF